MDSDNASEHINLDLLINTVRQRELIFYMKDPDYKNNLKKEEAWQEVADIVGTSPEEVKRLWTLLRDNFLRRFKKKMGSSSATSYSSLTKDWPFYDQMSWYLHYYNKKRSFSLSTPGSLRSFLLSPSSDTSEAHCRRTKAGKMSAAELLLTGSANPSEKVVLTCEPSFVCCESSPGNIDLKEGVDEQEDSNDYAGDSFVVGQFVKTSPSSTPPRDPSPSQEGPSKRKRLKSPTVKKEEFRRMNAEKVTLNGRAEFGDDGWDEFLNYLRTRLRRVPAEGRLECEEAILRTTKSFMKI
uniref:MADF domain-containing protein n=1 Tax=Timema douglasi TaxID=61478 RepID=A0A7R8VMN2_TIMDO|nr:unnamed protein product [Timema douglasi]